LTWRHIQEEWKRQGDSRSAGQNEEEEKQEDGEK
jgi:hypothetical protein